MCLNANAGGLRDSPTGKELEVKKVLCAPFLLSGVWLNKRVKICKINKPVKLF